MIALHLPCAFSAVHPLFQGWFFSGSTMTPTPFRPLEAGGQVRKKMSLQIFSPLLTFDTYTFHPLFSVEATRGGLPSLSDREGLNMDMYGIGKN
jgi:hypothetical protein